MFSSWTRCASQRLSWCYNAQDLISRYLCLEDWGVMAGKWHAACVCCSPKRWISTSHTTGWAANRCHTCFSKTLVQLDTMFSCFVSFLTRLQEVSAFRELILWMCCDCRSSLTWMNDPLFVIYFKSVDLTRTLSVWIPLLQFKELS